ncbi:hypothetical protein AS188_04320 [Kocuria flava]|uniref:Uncharacterized protein n=1 Tax=Kocuria flava TaxID=446860 RepID=A0A0U2YU96_9MICC|nr:hypothetical protein [Kocuria flava]ALU39105.1 hypothetical protein AS188_04320 [Kocuria flava]GEO90776.1 hypothetical protein KFL01_00820 [Kocuria flava]
MTPEKTTTPAPAAEAPGTVAATAVPPAVAPDAEQTPSSGTAERTEEKKSALSVPGLVTGAATAATMAVIGGHLSVAGTVLGAALTSIVSGVVVALYSTSLEKGKKGLQKVQGTVAGRLRRTGTASGAGSTAVAEERAPFPVRRFLASTGVIVGLAVAAIFAVQAVTGTELSGGTGQLQRTVTGSDAVAPRSAATTTPVEDVPAGGEGAAEGTVPTGAVPPDAPADGAAPEEKTGTGQGATGSDGQVADPAQPGSQDQGTQDQGTGEQGAVPDAGAQNVAPGAAAPAPAAPGAAVPAP